MFGNVSGWGPREEPWSPTSPRLRRAIRRHRRLAVGHRRVLRLIVSATKGVRHFPDPKWCMSTWGVVTSFASLSWHAAILQVQFMQTKTEQNAGNLTFLTPKLFAERAFRTVYNYHKSFRAYVRLWRNTDVTSIVYLQHGGVCRKRHCHPIYTVKQPMSFGSLGCKGIISRP